MKVAPGSSAWGSSFSYQCHENIYVLMAATLGWLLLGCRFTFLFIYTCDGGSVFYWSSFGMINDTPFFFFFFYGNKYYSPRLS